MASQVKNNQMSCREGGVFDHNRNPQKDPDTAWGWKCKARTSPESRTQRRKVNRKKGGAK